MDKLKLQVQKQAEWKKDKKLRRQNAVLRFSLKENIQLTMAVFLDFCNAACFCDCIYFFPLCNKIEF